MATLKTSQEAAAGRDISSCSRRRRERLKDQVLEFLSGVVCKIGFSAGAHALCYRTLLIAFFPQIRHRLRVVVSRGARNPGVHESGHQAALMTVDGYVFEGSTCGPGSPASSPLRPAPGNMLTFSSMEQTTIARSRTGRQLPSIPSAHRQTRTHPPSPATGL